MLVGVLSRNEGICDEESEGLKQRVKLLSTQGMNLNSRDLTVKARIQILFEYLTMKINENENEKVNTLYYETVMMKGTNGHKEPSMCVV